MKVSIQKILAFVLSVTLLICSFSIGASAQAGENEFAISKITVKGKTASATLSAPDNTTLVVAVYDETTNQMLGAGVKAVDSGTETADVNISISAMPKAYLVKAFLLDSDNASITKPFTAKSDEVESSTGFDDVELNSSIEFEISAQKISFSFDSAVPNISYIVINVIGYGDGFKLSSENLMFIDLVKADSSGKIDTEFMPKTLDKNSTTLLIGDLGGGTETVPIQAPVSIYIAKKPDSTSFTYKSSPSTKGLKVMAVYSGGVEIDVTENVTISGFNTSSVGAKTATVEYKGQTATFEYKVSYAWWQWIIRILLLGIFWY